jgi:hypothetical protein
MLIIFSIVSSLLFYEDNKEFFNEVHQQTTNNPDLEWNYVGKQKVNPNVTVGDDYIYFRLEGK